jgi:hypothetical protein
MPCQRASRAKHRPGARTRKSRPLGGGSLALSPEIIDSNCVAANSALGLSCHRRSSLCRGLGIKIVATDWFQILIQFIDQRLPRGDI